MNSYFRALKKYAVFRGRASRREYWVFMLIHTILIIGTVVYDSGGANNQVSANASTIGGGLGNTGGGRRV